MSDENNNNGIIILAIAVVGIMTGFFAYLIYKESQSKQSLQQSLNTQSNAPNFNSLTSPNINESRINELERELHKHQLMLSEYELNDLKIKLNSNHEQLKQTESIPHPKLNIKQMNNDIENKTRQKIFDMR